LLLFALALTLGLSTSPGDKFFFLILVDRLCIGPLLVILGAFVGLAGFWDACTKSKLLLSLLSEVFGIRDAVILGLRFSCRQGLELFTIRVDRSIRTVLYQCLLLISLGDALASLLIRKLSIAFIRAPAMSSLLLGITDALLGKRGFTWRARRSLTLHQCDYACQSYHHVRLGHRVLCFFPCHCRCPEHDHFQSGWDGDPGEVHHQWA
jgi:hypothetical protein